MYKGLGVSLETRRGVVELYREEDYHWKTLVAIMYELKWKIDDAHEQLFYRKRAYQLN